MISRYPSRLGGEIELIYTFADQTVEMKEGGDIVLMPRQSVVAVSPGVAYLSPPVGVAVHTPSPFSFSVTSARWSTSSRPSIDTASLFLRAMVLVFSFGSSLALAASMPNNSPQSFQHHPELIYSFVITTLMFIYSAYQLFKGVCDITFRGILISDKTSDYASFILDQLASYLLVSCSSVALYQQLERNTSIKKAVIISVCMSIAALLTTIVCGILSGYKLSKRIMW